MHSFLGCGVLGVKRGKKPTILFHLHFLSEKKKELKKNRNSGAREGTEIMEGLTPCDVFLVVIGKGYGLKVARHRLSLKYFPIRVSGSD